MQTTKTRKTRRHSTATNMRLEIFLQCDPDAEVWIATSLDVPGLVLEDASCDALMAKVRVATPELLDLNHKAISNYQLVFRSREIVPVNG